MKIGQKQLDGISSCLAGLLARMNLATTVEALRDGDIVVYGADLSSTLPEADALCRLLRDIDVSSLHVTIDAAGGPTITATWSVAPSPCLMLSLEPPF